MIVLSGANTVSLRFTRTVIMWGLAFLIGPWPALACIIHCLELSQPDSKDATFFICDTPHAPDSHPLPPPPIRYEVVGTAFMLFIVSLTILQRLAASTMQPVCSLNVAPDPPPPRARLENPLRFGVGSRRY